LKEEIMSNQKVETLPGLMARLNHLERLTTDEHDIVLFQALLHAELPRISRAVAALTEFIRDGLHSDDVLVEMGRQLLARLDRDIDAKV